MSLRWFFLFLLVLAVASAAWHYRDDPDVRRLLRMAPGVSSSVPTKPGAPSTSAAPIAPPAGLHKCRKGNQVEYSSVPCPPGSVEEKISGGAVTVMPAQGGAQTPAAQPGSASGEQPLKQAMEKLAR